MGSPARKAQVFGQGRGAGVAVGGHFLQTGKTNRLQVARHPRLQLGGRRRFLVNDAVQHVHGGLPRERRFACQHFIENDAETVNVRAAADLAQTAAGLFRRHVTGRAQDVTGLGQGLHVGPASGLNPFRQAEIADLRLAFLGQQHVAWLQIAMNDAALVGEMHGPGQDFDELACLAGQGQGTG